MPITREGQRVRAAAEELNRWMGRETSEPVHIATESADLSAELRRGLSYVKKQKQVRTKGKRRRLTLSRQRTLDGMHAGASRDHVAESKIRNSQRGPIT